MPEQSKTVDMAMRVLFEVRRVGSVTATGLARRLDVSRQAVLRAAATLESHGMLRRRGTRFELGACLIELASGLEHQLRADAQPSLTDLVREFGETAVLMLRQGPSAVPIEQITSPDRMVRIQYQPGQLHPLTQTAHGRSLLVGMRSRALEDLGIDPAAIVEDMQHLEDAGYLVAEDEFEVGTVGLASPIRAPDGLAIAAIGIVAPGSRFPDERTVARSVRRAAAEVARRRFVQSD